MDRTGAPYPPPPDSSFLNGLLGTLWRYKFAIGAATLVCTAAATALSFVVDDRYQASVVLSSVSEDSTSGRLGGLASIASQLGGLASLGLSAASSSQKQESLATLQSEALTERFINQNNLLPILYASKWDPIKRDWKPMPREEIPTPWKANEFFKRHIRNVSSDTKTGLTTLKITWKDPNQAASWANGLVKMTNEYLRRKAIQETDANINYLKDQLSRSTIIAVQNAISSVLESEMNKSMLAQGNEEFALKVIDPAEAPERRISPIPALWILMGFLLGLIGSTLVAFVARYKPIRVNLNPISGDRPY
jgi:capsular polysaccharide biosynthesis protein